MHHYIISMGGKIMAKEKKTKTNNQWAAANAEVTSKREEKTATDNQWASTNKKSVE